MWHSLREGVNITEKISLLVDYHVKIFSLKITLIHTAIQDTPDLLDTSKPSMKLLKNYLFWHQTLSFVLKWPLPVRVYFIVLLYPFLVLIQTQYYGKLQFDCLDLAIRPNARKCTLNRRIWRHREMQNFKVEFVFLAF